MPRTHWCCALVNVVKESYLSVRTVLPICQEETDRFVPYARQKAPGAVQEGTEPPQGRDLQSLPWESIPCLSDAAQKQGSQHLMGHEIFSPSIFPFLCYLIQMAMLLHYVLLCLS